MEHEYSTMIRNVGPGFSRLLTNACSQPQESLCGELALQLQECVSEPFDKEELQ